MVSDLYSSFTVQSFHPKALFCGLELPFRVQCNPVVSSFFLLKSSTNGSLWHSSDQTRAVPLSLLPPEQEMSGLSMDNQSRKALL